MQDKALMRSAGLDHLSCAPHMRGMAILSALFWSNHFWAGMSALSGVIVLVSSLADRRRNRRTNMEAVGFMPWTAITVFSLLATVVAAALAIKGM